MTMRLIPKSRLHRVIHDDLSIRVNCRPGAIYQDEVTIESDTCTVKIEVLKDETTSPVHGDSAGTPEALDPDTSPNNSTTQSPIEQTVSAQSLTPSVEAGTVLPATILPGGPATTTIEAASVAAIGPGAPQERISLQLFAGFEPMETISIRSPEDLNSHSRDSIYSTDGLRLEPPVSTSTSGELHNRPSRSVRKLEMTFLGIPKFYLAFHTRSSCKCNTCKGWKTLETISLGQDGGFYGVIAFEMAKEGRIRDICQSHEMKMGLISWDRRDDATMRDLVLDVNGQGQNAPWIGDIEAGSMICTVSMLDIN